MLIKLIIWKGLGSFRGKWQPLYYGYLLSCKLFCKPQRQWVNYKSKLTYVNTWGGKKKITHITYVFRLANKKPWGFRSTLLFVLNYYLQSQPKICIFQHTSRFLCNSLHILCGVTLGAICKRMFILKVMQLNATGFIFYFRNAGKVITQGIN